MIARVSLLIAVLMALMVPVHAEEQVLEQSMSGQITFVTPSNNIGCVYTPASNVKTSGTRVYEPRNGADELVCERVEPSYVTVVLLPAGKAQRIDNPGEQGCCSLDQQLGYNNVTELGPFVCISRRSGLTCRNGDGHGFTMARAGVTLK